MSPTILISNLSAQSVRLWAEGDRLKFDAPAGALTPELRAELAARKSELLRLLSAAEPPADGPARVPALRLVPKPERLRSVRSRSGQLTACLFDNCGGKAERLGVDIWQCAECGERFKVQRLAAKEVELFDKWIN